MAENLNPSPRRIGLTILFVLWLSVQGAVIGLTPAWGFILPHDHVLRGPMTEADWEQHMEEHRLGIVVYSFTPNCSVPQTQQQSVAESVPDLGVSSVFTFFTGNLDAVRVTLRAPHTHSVAVLSPYLYASDIFLAPLEPPPNI